MEYGTINQPANHPEHHNHGLKFLIAAIKQKRDEIGQILHGTEDEQAQQLADNVKKLGSSDVAPPKAAAQDL